MTHKDIYEALCNTYTIIDSLSKDEIKRLLRILQFGQCKHRCVFCDSVDLVQYAKNLLTDLMKYNDLLAKFNKNQMKSLYGILADYGIYQTCPLCGEPIKMRSNKYSTEFSWDHVLPKSLGGVDGLENLQPTHKECNSLKGNNISYHVHYEIDMVVNINVNMPETSKQKHNKKKNLHKKDYWRHNGRGSGR